MPTEIYIKKTDNRKDFALKILNKYSNEFSTKHVFIKPNIVSYENYPTTTHPDLLKIVIEYLQKKNCTITVGDGPAPTSGRSDKILEKHLLTKVCSELGVELLSLHKQGFTKIKTDYCSLKISSIYLQSEYVISLPVLKGHQWTDLTGALKNQFGFFPNRERILLHSPLKNLHQAIAAINKVKKPDLFIMDAIETYKNANEKRQGGIQTKLGYMLAGTDPVALDCLGLRLLQKVNSELQKKTPLDILHIRYADELGVGTINFKEIELE